MAEENDNGNRFACEGLPSSRSEAKSLGIKHYFTGRECSNGHIEKRLTVDGCCQECRRLKDRKRYWSDPDKARDRVKTYYTDNLEKRLSYSKRRYDEIGPNYEWKRNNPDSLKESQRKYRERHKDAINERKRATYASNPEHYRGVAKKWASENPDIVRAFRSARRAMVRNAEGVHSADDIARIRSLQKERCACCRIKLNGKWHVDHIVPLAKGGTNWASNIQLLCAKCNLSKSAADPIDFMRRQGKLL